MQPTPTLPRRKRKRPGNAKAETEGQSFGESEDVLVQKTETTRSAGAQKKVSEPKAEPDPAEATRAEEPTTLDRPFRGKCLYQSRKCENERALKRNGKAHNLCDEHRSKQNQHQRKFDAKKYSRRKTDGSSGDDEDHDNDSADGKTLAAIQIHKPRAVSLVKKDTRTAAATNSMARLAAARVSESVAASTGSRQYSRSPESVRVGATHPDFRRRPPSLQVARSPPATIGDNMAQRPPPIVSNTETSYARGELLTAGMLVQPHSRLGRLPEYTSPRDPMQLAFLPRPTLRSQSFDSGVSRISPVGSAALGVGGVWPFDRQQHFMPDQPRAYERDTSPKLPSLQQLPLVHPSYASSHGHSQHHSPDDTDRQRPSHSHSHSHHHSSPYDRSHSPPYYTQRFDPRDAGHSHAGHRPLPSQVVRGSLLPPLAPLLQPPHHSGSSPSLSVHHQQQSYYQPPRESPPHHSAYDETRRQYR